MSVTVILGEQRGDEGKGRFVDMLAVEHDIVARFNGGNNAGHTVVLPDGRVLKLHMVPSGIAHPHTINIIGNGSLVNPVKLVEEIRSIESQGISVTPKNLLISTSAHLILPHHISADEIREAGAGKQGSTKSGIAQVSADKYRRVGVRCESLQNDLESLRKIIIESLEKQKTQRNELKLNELDSKILADEFISAAKKLNSYITDTVYYLNDRINSNHPPRILAEGAQAFLLDIDHGMYPYTTSSSTTSGAVATGLGIPPYKVSRVLGVSKAVQSHVGGGVFATEITDTKLLSRLHGDKSTVDAEYGTTTGRVRRLGNLDIPGIRRSNMVNGTHEIALTKLDWVPRYGDFVDICTAYKIDNETVTIAPDSCEKLEKAKPIYERLPTWQVDISGIRKYSDLPKEAKDYIEFIESKTGLPIAYIGVGPNREQVIIR